MAYPPQLPPVTRTDSTLAAVTHAKDHNQIAAALRDVIAALGASPSGGYANLTDRLLGVAAGQDQAALDEFRRLSDLVADVSGIAVPDNVVRALLNLNSSETRAAFDTLVGARVNPALATDAGQRLICFGDSLSSPEGGAPTGQGVFDMVKHKSGGRLTLVRNSGVPGNNTTQMLARIQADVIAHSPQVVTLLAGTNDLTQGVAAATMRANVTAIYDALKAAGINLVLIAVPPRNLADKKLPETTAWNAWLRNFARSNRLHFIDIHTPLSDPATGGYLAPYGNADGLHFSREGAAKVADVILENLLPLVPVGGITRPANNVDPGNLLSNPLLLAGANDASPTSWLYNAANAAVTRGRVNAPQFRGGKAWRIAIDGTQAADVTSSLTQNAAAAWAIGDRLRFVVRYEIVSGSELSQDGADVASQKGFGFTALFFGAPAGAVNSIARYQSLPGTAGVAWADLTVPAGTTGPVQWTAAVAMPAGKSIEVLIGEAAVYNLTQQGAI